MATARWLRSGEPGANVPVLRDGQTNFTGCPYSAQGLGTPLGTRCRWGLRDPRTYVSSTSVTKDVRVSIHKENAGSLSYVHDVTLRVAGTDKAAMNHSVFVSPNVGWLTLPSSATWWKRPTRPSCRRCRCCSSSGLMEQIEPYTTTIHLLGHVTTSNQLALNVQPLTGRDERFQISRRPPEHHDLGTFSPDQARVGCANIVAGPGVLEVRIGQTATQSFTVACDPVLPVNHPLQAQGTPAIRRTVARWAMSDARRHLNYSGVVYASAGVYMCGGAPAVIGPAG